MEIDDNRKKKVWKKKTKQIKSTAKSSSFSSENKDSVDQNHVVESTDRSCFSKPPGDLNLLYINGNEDAFIHGKNGEFWMEKQAEMEAVIADLQHQKDLLSEKEKINMKSLDRLHGDNTQLYLQVMELEKSQSSLLEENEQLLKKISILQSQIQILERIISSNNFSTENLKVNESGVEMRSIDSAPSTDPTAQTTQVLDSALEAPGPDYCERRAGDSVRDSPTEEPPPEVRINGDMESRIAGGEDEEGSVSLSHAPLIGAPFRFISFVAGYVSGADLVTFQQ